MSYHRSPINLTNGPSISEVPVHKIGILTRKVHYSFFDVIKSIGLEPYGCLNEDDMGQPMFTRSLDGCKFSSP